MELETMEKNGRLVVDMGKNHTLANLIRKAVWESGGEAGYDKGHPLGEESNLVIEADDPEEVLEDAVEQAREWLDEVEEEAPSA
jgi:DNA-directed RNA polymerase subunit L